MPLRRFYRYSSPSILVVSLVFVYAVTLAPGLTWANDGSDGGDLIAAAATGGIAHPTGYPLYPLLARLFQLFPFGSLAFRTNPMSALATILGATLVYWLVTRCIPEEKSILTWAGGLVAGYAFGLLPLVWLQAVITEVYALQALLVLLIIFLCALPMPTSKRSQANLDRWRGLLLGLAMDNHITAVFLGPPALLLGSIHWRGEEDDIAGHPKRWFDRLGFDYRDFYRQLIWLGLGLSLYFVLPLRAMAAPPINWGNPVTLQRF
jgi:hypothetical protein